MARHPILAGALVAAAFLAPHAAADFPTTLVETPTELTALSPAAELKGKKPNLAAAHAWANDCMLKQAWFRHDALGESISFKDFKYASDAKMHFLALHQEYNDIVAGLTLSPPEEGPIWLGTEALFRLEPLLKIRGIPDLDSVPLSDLFGPYIPLFFDWTVLHKAAKSSDGEGADAYPLGFIQMLMKSIRPDVLYITVVDMEEGMSGRCELAMKRFPNILVLSAGGYGQVPVPYFDKLPEPNVNPVPVADRQYLVSFVGKNRVAPHDLRVRMVRHTLMARKEMGFTSKAHYQGEDWMDVRKQSKSSLCPRGVGRLHLHLTECLQAGFTTMAVYDDDDIPWVPYRDLYERELGFVVGVNQLRDFLRKLAELTDPNLATKEENIKKYSESHYTYQGAGTQILKLMLGFDHDLQCQALPTSIRFADVQESLPTVTDEFYVGECL